MSNVIAQAKSGIYIIKHVESGRCYVGSARNIKSRWMTHRSVLDRDKHHSTKLQNAWNKYGALAFSWEVVESVPDVTSLIVREQFWMDTLNASDKALGLNVAPRAGSPLGFKHAPEVYDSRRKPQSPELIAKRSIACTGWKHTEESRAKISSSNISKVHSPEHLANQSAAQKGKPKSPEHLANMRAAAARRSAAGELEKSPETRAKIAASVAASWIVRKEKWGRGLRRTPA